MPLQNPSRLGIVFVALAVIFLGITCWNYLTMEEKMTIARKIWLRMAFIFAGIGIGISFLAIFFPA